MQLTTVRNVYPIHTPPTQGIGISRQAGTSVGEGIYEYFVELHILDMSVIILLEKGLKVSH